MEHIFQQVRDLYSNHLNECTNEQRYFNFSPGGVHEYYFRPTSKNIIYLADMICGEGIKRQSAFYLLKSCSRTPEILKYVPMFSETKLVVGDQTPPEIIAVSKLVRLLSQSGGVVHTVPVSDSEKVRAVLDKVLLLPSEVSTPELLDWDRDVPYFTEEFIEGDLAGPPTTSWKHYISAYKNLSELYRRTIQESDETIRVINNTINNINNSLIDKNILAGIRTAFDTYDYPKYIKKCRIHGDVNQRNIILSENTTYLIDWEGSRVEYATYDLFRPFLIQYYDTQNAGPLIELTKPYIGNRERGADFAAIVGPDMYGESRWYPGLLFMSIVRYLNYSNDESWMQEDTLNIIEKILSSNGWITS